MAQESIFHHLTARDINTNQDINLGKYRGQVVLIVNVASEYVEKFVVLDTLKFIYITEK